MAQEQLCKKVALVTGAARRVGAKFAKSLHENGANVVIHCRHSRHLADELAAELNDRRSNSAAVVQADLADDNALTPMVEEAAQTWGRLDILINNASSFFPTPLGEVDNSAWNELIGSNLKGPFFITQAAAPHLRETRGCVINMIDIHGERPIANHTVYCAAKAGLHALTRAFAIDLAPEIRVNGIAPGAILWPEGDAKLSDKERQQILDSIPLGHIGSPGDLVSAMLYLVSSGQYVTGQIMRIDGGRSCII